MRLITCRLQAGWVDGRGSTSQGRNPSGSPGWARDRCICMLLRLHMLMRRVCVYVFVYMHFHASVDACV